MSRQSYGWSVILSGTEISVPRTSIHVVSNSSLVMNMKPGGGTDILN